MANVATLSVRVEAGPAVKALADLQQRLKGTGREAEAARLQLSRFSQTTRTVTDAGGNVVRQYTSVGQSFARAAQGGGLLVRSFEAIKIALASVGVALTVGALVSFVRSAVEMASTLQDTAEQLRVNVELLQALGVAGREAGIGQDQVATSLTRLNESIGEAAGGNLELQKSFVDLGVSFKNTDGTARTTEQVFGDLAKSYAEAGDKQKFLAQATDVGGRNFARLAPILDRASRGIQEFTEAERRTGAMSAQTIKDLDQLSDNLDAFVNVTLRGLAGNAVHWFQQIFGVGLAELSSVQRAIEMTSREINLAQLQLRGGPRGIGVGLDPETERGIEERLRLLKLESDALRLRESLLLNPPTTRPVTPAPPEVSADPAAARRLQDYIDKLKFENELIYRNARAQEILNAVRAAGTTLDTAAGQEIARLVGRHFDEEHKIKDVTLAFKAWLDLQREGQELAERLRTPTEAYAAAIDRLNVRLEQGAISQETFNRAVAEADRALLESSRDFGAGVQLAFEDYVDAATNASENVQEVLRSAFTGLEDVLTQFFTTGKLKFADFLRTLAEDLARFAVRVAILGPLLGWLQGFLNLGGAGGFNRMTWGSTAGGLGLFQHGGVIPAGGWGLVGERGPELVHAGSASRVIDNTVSRQLLGGGNSVSFVFGDVNVNAPASAAGDPRAAGEQIGAEVKRALRALIAEEVRQFQRPGGLLNPGPVTR